MMIKSGLALLQNNSSRCKERQSETRRRSGTLTSSEGNTRIYLQGAAAAFEVVQDVPAPVVHVLVKTAVSPAYLYHPNANPNPNPNPSLTTELGQAPAGAYRGAERVVGASKPQQNKQFVVLHSLVML